MKSYPAKMENVEFTVTPIAEGKGRDQATGFRNTYRCETLVEDMSAMIKQHLPQVEDWQAKELSGCLLLGVIRSSYLRVR